MGDKKYLILILILMTPFLSAQDPTYVIANSENWKDVYSTMLYGSLAELDNGFLTSTNHGTEILNDIRKENEILVISSRDSPYMFNYPDLILSKGFADAEEIETSDANLRLIEELEDVNNFVIVGDSYGYNAIAVAPYAIQKNSWVFLANNRNINEIDSILSRKNINEILIYGYVDREVRETLEKYSPKTIDTKDRFKDNIEIVEEYLKINPSKQVLLTNGEFIEKQLMLGTEPTLFTGKENVPDQIRDYLKDSSIEIGILIGNDLIGTATNIKKSTGISVMVKFARGARSQTEGVAAVEGLDIFPVPTPTMKLTIYSLKYNIFNSLLEVTYKSDSNIPLYLKGTITIEGNRIGDAEPVFIAPGNFKTLTYETETLPEDTEAEVFTLYGESSSALDMLLQETLNIETVEIIDNCEIEIESAKYNQQNQKFGIKIKNTANVDCWINLEIQDIKTTYEDITIGTETPEKINPKKSKTIYIEEELSEEDLSKNQFIQVVAHFGEREDSLVKILEKTLELKIERFGVMTYAISATILIILILLIIIFILRRKEEEGY